MAPHLRIYLGKERAPYEQPLLGPTAERAGKRIRQGLRAGEIRERVTHFASLRQLFEQLQPLWQRLRRSAQAITYYAEYGRRAQAAPRYRRAERRYPYLLRFMVPQYYELGDALVEAPSAPLSPGRPRFSSCRPGLPLPMPT